MQNLKNKMSCVKQAIANNKFLLGVMGLVMISLWMNNALAFDPGSDILGAAKGDITKNFGESSTVMYAVYVAEIFAGVAAYIKSKNLFSLIGLAIVLIFTTVGFSLIGA